MPVINDLIDDLIDEHKILPDTLLIEDAAEVTEDLHHPVQDVHDIGGRDIVLGSCHKEYSKLLRVEVANPVHVEAWGRVSLPELHFSEEDLTCLSTEIQTDYIIIESQEHIQSLVMIVSPLAERIKNCDSIFKYYII